MQLIPVALHEPVRVVLDGVVVVVDCKLLQPRVGFQVLLVGDLTSGCSTSSKSPADVAKNVGEWLLCSELGMGRFLSSNAYYVGHPFALPTHLHL